MPQVGPPWRQTPWLPLRRFGTHPACAFPTLALAGHRTWKQASATSGRSGRATATGEPDTLSDIGAAKLRWLRLQQLDPARAGYVGDAGGSRRSGRAAQTLNTALKR